MLIRAPAYDDIPALIDMGSRIHEEGAYAFLPFNREKVGALIASYIEEPDWRFGAVAEEDGALIGMMGGYVTDYFFCDELVACDVILFVERAFRGGSAAARLIEAFREWAAARGARELCLGVSTNINKELMDRFYKTLGFTHVGGLYKLPLNRVNSHADS